MKSFMSFTKKELTAQLRSVKFKVLIGIFILFGILNPLFAKLIPYLFEALNVVMESAGMESFVFPPVTDVDSWVQFFENAPLYALIFVILHGSIFTQEYGNSTLVLVLTKGFDRYKVVISKTAMLFGLWSFYALIYFASTYCANLFFWDVRIAQNLPVSILFFWIGGLWICSFVVFLSSVAKSAGPIIASAIGLYFLSTIFAVIPKIQKYLPTYLMSGTSLVNGTKLPSDYLGALLIALGSATLFIAVSIPIFNKKQV